MSTMRKALKVLSLLAVVGGIDLLITLIVLNTSGDQAPDLLHSIVMGFVILFAFLLSAQGISAANVPVRARAPWRSLACSSTPPMWCSPSWADVPSYRLSSTR